MIFDFGAKTMQPTPADRSLEAGRSLVVFMMLDLAKAAPPRLIEHRLGVTDFENKPHELVPPALAVSDQSAIVVAPPLRGEWIAGDSVHNTPDAAHRRAIAVEGGRPWLAQRYAIDWVQFKTVDGVRTTWTGPQDRNESYFCYDQPIHSVAAGKVVGTLDGLAENVPHSGKFAFPLDFINAAGNHVVVEIAPERYVLYAHMRPGSVRVKVGDTVATGDVLGHVGNTGSSSEPHLRMHIDDHPSFLGGNGVPYEFTEFSASGPVEVIVKPGSQVISFGPIGEQKPFTRDYPATNALVTFK